MFSQTFELWSFSHALAVALSAGLVTVLILLRRHCQTSGRNPDRFDHVYGIALLLAWIAQNVWWSIPPNLVPAKTLPLHLCDLASFAAPFALLTRHRTFRTIIYFWGLGLTSQAYVTPTLQEGPALAAYWLFWLNHFSIVGTAVYDVIARRYRPAWADYRKAVAALLLYAAIIFPLNLLTGWNYGFIGQGHPDSPTLLDVLGPWPWRVGVIFLLVLIATAGMVVVWQLPCRMLTGTRGT